MKQIILLSTIFIFLNSCNKQEKISQIKPENKKEKYLKIIKDKKISFNAIGDCEDALEDTTHEDDVAYIESKKLNKNSLQVNFKVKSVCCQEYLGDYKIKNDTLFFEFEQVNDEVCSCICWYKFELKIDSITEPFNEIFISEKK